VLPTNPSALFILRKMNGIQESRWVCGEHSRSMFVGLNWVFFWVHRFWFFVDCWMLTPLQEKYLASPSFFFFLCFGPFNL
jgi:hypothetical protein